MPNNIIPPVLAGPILRKTTTQEVNLWLALRCPSELRLTLTLADNTQQIYQFSPHHDNYHCIRLGQYLHIALLHVSVYQELPKDSWISYTLDVLSNEAQLTSWQGVKDWAPHLLYADHHKLGFMIPTQVGSVLHGSCRKPHHNGSDGLALADQMLANMRTGQNNSQWPSMLIMSGDQIYADDVAGSTLQAIQQLAQILGLQKEALPSLGSFDIHDSNELANHQLNYYQRHHLLPATNSSKDLHKALFKGVKKPIFTSANAHNHLISLSEYLLMYILVWSPTPWKLVSNHIPDKLYKACHKRFQQEQQTIDEFIQWQRAAIV